MTRALVGISSLAMVACSSPDRSSAPNLVLIVMDTVRVDHLSAYGYDRPTSPFLESFADQGTRFDRAWSTSSWTLPAHASMFTGLLPSGHGATQSHLELAGDPTLLAELLAEAGYHCAGFSNNPWISDKTGLAAGFEDFGELWRKKERPETVWADPSSERVQRWLEESWDHDRPFFLFVNLMEAHGPYEPDWIASWATLGGPLEGRRARGAYDPVQDKGFVRQWYGGRQPVDAEALDAAEDLYDSEIRQVDAVVERIVGEVDKWSDPASTTVLIATDHGESFGEHGHVGHAFSVYDTLLKVALLARGPGLEPGAERRETAQLTDLFPTLAGAAGLELDEGPIAMDLRQTLPEQRLLGASYAFPRQVLGTFPPNMRKSDRLDPHRRSFEVGLNGRYKLIRDSLGHEEVYDLLEDPGEERPLEAPDEELLAGVHELHGHAVTRLLEVKNLREGA